jgi:tetratricopeptide (TPR) repeat protein
MLLNGGLLLVVLIALEGCATKSSSVNSGADDAGDGTEMSGRNSGEIVVMQTGASEPIISGSTVNHWIQLRNSEKSPNRLFGMLATGSWTQATEEARRELEKTPGDPKLMITLASSFAGQKNYEMAAYYANQVLKSSPANADAMNYLGLRAMTRSGNRRADYDEAISWFRKASENDGRHIAALLNMGHLQLNLGDGNGAIESFSLASNRCKQCFAAQYGFGMAATRTGAWSQAKTAFEGILSRDKSRADAQYELALVFKNGLSDPKRCVELLQDIISDSDGRFKQAGRVKTVANITLRRIKASDRSAPALRDIVVPRGHEMPARTR